MTAFGIEHGAVYSLVGPLGDRAVINNSADADHVGFINEGGVTGLEGGAVRENADTLPEADGGVHGTFYGDRLTWTLAGTIDLSAEASGITRQDKLLRASAALDADGVLSWVPSTIPGGVYCAFREQQRTRITGRRPRSFLVAGVCEDPYIYSQTLHSQVIVPAVGAGGFSSPLSSPLTSTPFLAPPVTVQNAGSGKAWPLIIVNGPCSNPVITNATTGRSIYLTYSLNAGEYLSIDTNPRRRTIRLNDQASRFGAYDFARSAWWWLRPGAAGNDIRVGFATFSAGATVELRWRDAWG